MIPPGSTFLLYLINYTVSFIRRMCFDYCPQIGSERQDKNPQKEQELRCSHSGPCYQAYHLLPPGLREQTSCGAAARLCCQAGKKPVIAVLVSNSKRQTRGICSSLLYQGFPLRSHVHKSLLNFMP